MNFADEHTLVDFAKGKHGPEGARRAWDFIVKRYSGLMYSVAQKIVRAWHLADEIVQSSLIRAMNAITFFELHTKFSAWLAAITRNAALNFIRDEKRHRTYEELRKEELAPEPLTAPDVLVWRTRLGEILNEAMEEQLTPDQRLVFTMSESGYQYDEIARHAKIPIGTVMSRKSRARQALRRNIDQYLDDEDR